MNARALGIKVVGVTSVGYAEGTRSRQRLGHLPQGPLRRRHRQPDPRRRRRIDRRGRRRAVRPRLDGGHQRADAGGRGLGHGRAGASSASTPPMLRSGNVDGGHEWNARVMTSTRTGSSTNERPDTAERGELGYRCVHGYRPAVGPTAAARPLNDGSDARSPDRRSGYRGGHPVSARCAFGPVTSPACSPGRRPRPPGRRLLRVGRVGAVEGRPPAPRRKVTTPSVRPRLRSTVHSPCDRALRATAQLAPVRPGPAPRRRRAPRPPAGTPGARVPSVPHRVLRRAPREAGGRRDTGRQGHPGRSGGAGASAAASRPAGAGSTRGRAARGRRSRRARSPCSRWRPPWGSRTRPPRWPPGAAGWSRNRSLAASCSASRASR